MLIKLKPGTTMSEVELWFASARRVVARIPGPTTLLLMFAYVTDLGF